MSSFFNTNYQLLSYVFVFFQSHETAVTMTLQVDKLVQSLPHVKWSGPVHKELQWLLDACIQYIAINFVSVVGQQNFEMLFVVSVKIFLFVHLLFVCKV